MLFFFFFFFLPTLAKTFLHLFLFLRWLYLKLHRTFANYYRESRFELPWFGPWKGYSVLWDFSWIEKKKNLRQYSTALWSLDLCQRSQLWGSSRKTVLLVRLWAYLYLLQMVTSACWRESKYVPTMCRLRLSWNGEAVTTYVLYLIYLYLEYYENMKIKLKCI